MAILFISQRPVDLPKGRPEDLPKIQHRPLDKTPSLIPVIQAGGFSAVVVEPEGQYSVAHILSANRLAASLGICFVVIDSQSYPKKANLKVILPEERETLFPALLEAVKKPAQKVTASAPSRAPGQKPAQNSAPQKGLQPLKDVDKLTVPPLITVAGSQHRVGCTTQCFQLYAYCRAVGLRPALLLPSKSIRLLASMVDCQEKHGVTYISGIPILPDTRTGFNCYIADLGILTEQTQKSVLDGTVRVLVSGAKPWEIAETVKALQYLPREQALILLSFCGADGQLQEGLSQLTGGTVGVAPVGWTPDIFQPTKQFDPFEKFLRPLLEAYISQLKKQKEESL